jgi:chloramphenicol 3-O-phosphotransferase
MKHRKLYLRYIILPLQHLIIIALKESQRPSNMSNPRKAVVVGVSGCSSSGKTTISRLLRDIFPNTFILHEDDFYLPEMK